MEKIRSFDQFGAPVSLQYDRETDYKTLMGGVASILLRALILVFLCIQMIQVLTYADPEISSFQVLEDRALMQTGPLSLGEYNTFFTVFFTDKIRFTPQPLDPKFGAIQISEVTIRADFENESDKLNFELDVKPVAVEEIDMTKESAGSNLLSYYPESTRGFYTVADFNEVHVENTLDDNDKTMISIVFTPCNKLTVTGLQCADEQEMDVWRFGCLQYWWFGDVLFAHKSVYVLF